MNKLIYLFAIVFVCLGTQVKAQQTLTVVNNTPNTLHYYLRMGTGACISPYPAGSKAGFYTLAAYSTSIVYDYTNVTIMPGYPPVTCASTFDGISFMDGCSPPPITEVTIGDNIVCSLPTYNMLSSGCMKPNSTIYMNWDNTNPMAIVVTVN